MSYNTRMSEFLGALALSIKDIEAKNAATTEESVRWISVALRLSDGRLPRNGLPKRIVEFPGFGKVSAWIAPLSPPPTFEHTNGLNYRVRRPRAGKHFRVYCECPKCGVELSAGRLHQHVDTGICVARTLGAA